ncbi:hypothetical protein B0A55_06749 [Friedmanniomyces simplex]|uniref:Peptide hydrolase n=1 Tax=Friedmanniomyces simplex TaxID=329884 RepID=A0A4U0X8J8_9PEZI|nr:hypothetical protein B0A55_06749 [Friedmanniomyces simplex]
MAKKYSWNPIAFVPAQVTVIASAVYIALFAALLWNHFTVPSAPSDPVPVKGINLTEAWLDLDFVSDGFHPFGSRRNDAVRNYLSRRVEGILKDNGVGYEVVGGSQNSTQVAIKGKEERRATVWTYDPANATFPEDWRHLPWTVYTESSNVVVYIKGKRDNDWDWRTGERYKGHGGVLVNAHYDSVSTAYGATDDGVGVVTVLQLISYFTRDGNQPDHGIVALLNNGEENGLYGAHSYLMHPMAPFTHAFLNLEGAGAGGKATLFRSTDAEITKFYASAPNPYGSVISADGFKQGFIRSGTDYSIFTQSLGMRGLDVAFFAPRARYHTNQDSARETNPDSVWHMLSTSLETMKALVSYDGEQFDGSVDRRGKLDLEAGSTGVWFDLFGRAFAVMQLNTLFALSVTLLVAGPILLILLEVLLVRNDKWYLFSRKKYLNSSDDDEVVHISGLRGFFRFPIAFVAASAAVVALGFLQTKLNPNIVYSSEYVVWAEMLTAWLAVAWFILAGGDRIRPTALQRMFCLIWLYIVSWLALVAATVGENNFGLGSGYLIVVYNAAVFAAVMISYFELFGLPSKAKYAEHVLDAVDENRSRPGSRSSRTLLAQSDRASSIRGPAAEEDETTESTSLLRGRDSRHQGTFAHHGKRRQPEEEGLEDSEDPFLTKAYGDEQAWSSSLPQWTWILQFLILAPINIILVGQMALLLTSALHQTPSDGNAVLPIYLIIAGFAILLLLPLTPFLHRFTYQLPTLLFLILTGCLIYNLAAFPFSRDARMKHYFVQTIDLDTGKNNVTLLGLDGYLQDIIAELPSAAGQPLHCGAYDQSSRSGLQSCAWPGLAPRVVPEQGGLAPYSNKTRHGPQSWLDYNVTFANRSAVFSVRGRNTKMCRLVFETPVVSVEIDGAATTDPRASVVAKNGSSQVRLFSRTWDKVFRVNVTWDEGVLAKGQAGRVACSWAESEGGEVPALDEVKRFAPVWSAVTQAGDGLVEGWRGFELRKIDGILPENRGQSSWGFEKDKPFTDDKDREQFVHAVIAVITNNGKTNLQTYKFRLLFSRRENDRLVARIVAELDGVIRAKIEPEEDGKIQAEAFGQLRRHVETRLEKILRDVPSDGTRVDAIAGPSRMPVMGGGRAIVPSEAPPAYEGDVKRKPLVR